ncbi:cell division protein FtsA [Psychrobacter sp. YP14]|jgi:cell division protein FtsA|uniref:Cell division protein FtsA n=3 Tax=Psychrobacter TaxID=497 RepID=A0A844LWY2_9GAMM|nr:MULTISPECIES: cell division protein FtsA [Psychrobacter]AWT48553.1 cell division protein FtsA [Psychrobacter sp. YP14]MUG31291.1 cell division protein FtsA [Psychrobacter sanguinis]
MSKSENLLAVIHLSATAVYVVVGNVISAKEIRIKGVGEVFTNDFQQGQITHFDRLKSSIRQAIIQAEEMANCRIHSVWLTLSTPELLSHNGFGVVDLDSGVVETQHIVNALTLAKASVLPNTHYLMHYCQQGIFLENQEKMVDDAIGMYANKVTVMYHLMMMPVSSRQNIQKLIQACDVSIDHMLFDAVSSAEYGLMPDEREQGVCLIDIGASTTSICVYRENKLIFTHCIADGGNNVTMDISAELNITMMEAERLKIEKGTVDTRDIDPSRFETFARVGSMNDEVTVNILQLAQIIEARYIELYKALFQKLSDAGLLDYLQRGVVLTGGGSQVKGMVRFSKRLLEMPVVLTTPHEAISAYNYFDSHDEKFKELNARVEQRSLQTAFGALLYSQSEQFKHSERSSPEALEVDKPNSFSRIRHSLNNFFKNLI